MNLSPVPHPAEVPSGEDESSATGATLRHTAPAVAQHALDLAADGCLEEAISTLSELEDHDAVLAAVEHLTATCAAVLACVPDRTRYPIPIDYVSARFSVLTDADAGMCLTMLQRAAFRAAGFDVDIHELTATHGGGAVLFGAFHSTHGVLQFLAGRWWVKPRSILDQLVT